jgi:hypothetical protein
VPKDARRAGGLGEMIISLHPGGIPRRPGGEGPRGHTVRNKATHIISAYRAALQLDPAATERVLIHRRLDQLTRP